MYHLYKNLLHSAKEQVLIEKSNQSVVGMVDSRFGMKANFIRFLRILISAKSYASALNIGYKPNLPLCILMLLKNSYKPVSR